jgi:hypothetical protein
VARHWRYQGQQGGSVRGTQDWRESSRCASPTYPQNIGCSLGVTGRPFTIDKVKLEDLENGVLTASWRLEASHSSVSRDKVEEMLKTVLIGTLVSSAKGAWDVSDEFNGLLPGFNFTQIEDFLAEVWEGKS